MSPLPPPPRPTRTAAPRIANRTAARLASFSSLLGFAALLSLVVAGGAAFPGYRHASQFISELGATGAPHEAAVRFAGFLPAGLFLLLFVFAAWWALPRSPAAALGWVGLAVFAAGYLAAAFFPCDPGCRPESPSLSQVVHNLAGLAGYLAAPLFLVALGLAARRWPGAGHVAAAGFVGAGLTLLGVLTLTPASPLAGVSQRVVEAGVWGWVLLCAVYLQTANAGAGGPAQGVG